MSVRLLSESDFSATFSYPMHRVPLEAEPPFDFWNYFDSIPAEHFCGHDCSSAEVDYAYTSDCDSYQHVLVNSESKNVFMVLVLDLRDNSVFGHRLLNLNEEYGISA